MAVEDNSNGKVTMALLGQRLAVVESVQREILAEVRKITEYYNTLNVNHNRLEIKTEINCNEISELRKSSNRWDAIIAVVMMILGALGLTRS